jgi:beta-galactosidase/beta-glucuronidase
MILRDRNHVCIIGWSLGNESGHGPAHNGAATHARRLDPTRFVQYEGAVMDRFVTFRDDPTALSQKAPSASERATTGIICPIYPPVDFILNWARWAGGLFRNGVIMALARLPKMAVPIGLMAAILAKNSMTVISAAMGWLDMTEHRIPD